MPATTATDQALAEQLCANVTATLLELRQRARTQRWTPQRLGRTADRTAHTMITNGIQAHDPTAVILSEEAPDDPHARSNTAKVWIIDPVDGTWEYQAGRTNWGIHIALWNTTTQHFDAAAIVAPDMPTRPRHDGLVIVRSATGNQPEADHVAATLGATIKREPSAGAKVLTVLNGTADAYIGKAGIAEWDLAAPIGTALAAGLRCSDHAGNPLTFNQERPRLPGFVIATRDMHQRVIDVLARPGQW